MPKGWIAKTSVLLAGAALAATTALLTQAPPAHATDCAQWQFNGPTSLLRETTTETANFAGTGSHVSAPATWTSNNGPTKQGNVVGDIDPNGHITVTFNFNKGGSVVLAGQVGPDGQASGLSEPNNEVPWHSLAPMGCAPPKEGPSLALDPGVGSLTIHVTDHSGVASTCQYSSDFVNRSFKLPANGTADLKVVPAVPLFIDHQVDITCDNGTATHTSAFF